MNLSIKAAKGNFFDKKAVTDAVGKAKAGVLGRQGALVRKIARNSMKKRKDAAPAGSPPSVHAGQIKDLLFFAYDAKKKVVVIGPAKWSRGKGKDPAPGVQEFGGQMKRLFVVGPDGALVPLYFLSAASRRAARAKLKVVFRMVHVAARPFMNPALEKAAPMLAKEWKGKVKK